MYEKNKELEKQIEELRHQEVPEPHPSPVTLRSSGSPERGARPSVKRRRLVERDPSKWSQITGGNASQPLSNVPNQKRQSPYSCHASDLMPSVNHTRSSTKLRNLARNPEQTCSATTEQRYHLSVQHAAHKATPSTMAPPTAIHVSSLRHGDLGQGGSSKLETPSATKPIRSLSIDDYPTESHTTAFSYNPRQNTLSSCGQQTSEHFLPISDNFQPAHMPSKTMRHWAQSAMFAQNRASRKPTFLESVIPSVNEGIMSHQHREYLAKSNPTRT